MKLFIHLVNHIRRSRNGGQLYERINDADIDEDDDSEVESGGEIAGGEGEGFANGSAGVAGRGRGGSGEQHNSRQFWEHFGQM